MRTRQTNAMARRPQFTHPVYTSSIHTNVLSNQPLLWVQAGSAYGITYSAPSNPTPFRVDPTNGAVFTHESYIPEGTYTFQVKATGTNTLSSQAVISIIVAPHTQQKRWSGMLFVAGMCFAAALLISRRHPLLL